MPKHLDEYVIEKNIDYNVNYTVDYCCRVRNILSTYDEAVYLQKASKWQKAMQEEIAALIDNDTNDLVAPPESRQTVGGRWDFAVKTRPNGKELHNCKFMRRLAREKVMAARRVVSNLNAEDLGFSGEVDVSHINLYDHLTPRLQELLFEHSWLCF